jgi:16S rRNA (uracil1498-N3)-methyltransferase
VERDARAPVATFFTPTPVASGETTTLGENAAHHARVKRLDVGDVVRLTDGAGRVGRGSISGVRRGALDVAVARVDDVARPSPIHLRVPVGDRDRMLWLAEKATELGVTTWQSVRFRRSASVSPRGEGPAFAEKLRARMTSALEQSGGAWLPAILPETSVAELSLGARELGIVLDIGGESLPAILRLAKTVEPVILFGPEGGIEQQEIESLTANAWRRARLAATTLRFETAGIAAVAVCRAMETETGY